MYSTHVSTFISIPFPPSKSKSHKHKYSKLCNSTPRMSLNQNPNTNLINAITKLLWGQSLPPQLLISTVRSTWSAAWQLMMSQLAPSDPTGSYTRPTSQFRLYSNPKLNFSPKDLHLYVGLPCPWAHRTLIVRALKGLEDSVPVSIASPGIDGSWEFRVFPDTDKDKPVPGLDIANGCKTLREVYNLRHGGYSGRSTVPMLWDVEKKEVLCNESYDIILFLNSGLNEIAGNPELDLSPPALKDKIRRWNDIIYPNVNNGVYR